VNVLLLLAFDDENVEVGLKPFVRVIYAKLLERIALEAFKAEHVENADERSRHGQSALLDGNEAETVKLTDIRK
jgi:hypothetical protein